MYWDTLDEFQNGTMCISVCYYDQLNYLDFDFHLQQSRRQRRNSVHNCRYVNDTLLFIVYINVFGVKSVRAFAVVSQFTLQPCVPLLHTYDKYYCVNLTNTVFHIFYMNTSSFLCYIYGNFKKYNKFLTVIIHITFCTSTGKYSHKWYTEMELQ